MANLFNQNIGLNYKGILNLGTSLNSPLSTTLQAITDGDGVASPLQLDTTQIVLDNSNAGNSYLQIGTAAKPKGQINIVSDALHYFLRIGSALSGNNQTIFIGDGNGAWETQFNGVTTQYWDFQNNVTIGNRIAYGNRLSVVAKAANNAAVFYTSAIGEIATFGFGGGNTTRFNGAVRTDFINDYANGYTLLQYVSATQIRVGNDALRLNPTTLAATFNSAVDSATSFTAPLFSHPTRGSIRWYSGDGVMTLMNSTENGFNRLNLGGLTNAAPAIKRNGAAIDFRLADDSGFCNVNMGQATFGGGNGYIGINNASSIDSALRNVRTNSGSSPLSISTGEVGVGDVTTYASAIFAIGSTTRGFLPPRMTTTERNAIASPASGLIVYDRTLNKLYLYTTAWEEITSA